MGGAASGGADVCVSAIGMVSALGHGAVPSCAAARAGISRAIELNVLAQPFGAPTMDGPPEMYGHAVSVLGAGFTGAGKVITLGAAALRDLLHQRPLDPREAAATGCILCLSDHAMIDAHAASRQATSLPSASWAARTSGVIAALADHAGIAVAGEHATVRLSGGPGFVHGLQEAARRIAEGTLERCLVGAVDSRIEPAFLTAAAGLGALRTNDCAVGLIGGEAAAFVLLERTRAVRAAKRTPLAAVTGFGAAREPTGHFDDPPPTGRALAEAVLAAARGCSPPAWWICDVNGTERRASEWGTTLMRLRAAGVTVDGPAWYPAVAFGDTGAAAGAVSLCVAVQAFARRYAPGRAATAWVQSESGASAAFTVEGPR